MRYCKECKYYKEVVVQKTYNDINRVAFRDVTQKLCSRVDTDPVTGGGGVSCSKARSKMFLPCNKSKYCGPEGKYFIPIKELKPLPPPIPPKTRTRGKND